MPGDESYDDPLDTAVADDHLDEEDPIMQELDEECLAEIQLNTIMERRPAAQEPNILTYKYSFLALRNSNLEY
jgi:hypothetical protein